MTNVGTDKCMSEHAHGYLTQPIIKIFELILLDKYSKPTNIYIYKRYSHTAKSKPISSALKQGLSQPKI